MPSKGEGKIRSPQQNIESDSDRNSGVWGELAVFLGSKSKGGVVFNKQLMNKMRGKLLLTFDNYVQASTSLDVITPYGPLDCLANPYYES